MEYDRGDRPVLRTAVTDKNGVAANPATIKLTVKSPSQALGAGTLYQGGQITNPSANNYESVIAAVDAVGTWEYEWETTNPDGFEPGSFRVRKSNVRA